MRAKSDRNYPVLPYNNYYSEVDANFPHVLKNSWIAIMINNSCTFKARMKMMTCQISDPVHNNPAMRLRWSHCCPPILLIIMSMI